MTTYPPEPWHLRGRGEVSLWRVPAADVPPLPHGVHALTLRGRALAVTAFVDYADGGLLAYRELLAAVLVRHGRVPALSITHIWVDSPTSRAGGRELWGIPKELADLELPRPGSASARLGGELLAAASLRAGRLPALPLPAAVRGRVVQTLGGRTVATRVLARGRLRRATGGWRIPQAGPLGWLTSARALLHVHAEDVRLTFGPRLPDRGGRAPVTAR